MTSLRFRLTYKDDEPEVETDLHGCLDKHTRITSLRFRLTNKDDKPEV